MKLNMIKLVCPNEPALLKRIKNRMLCVHVKDYRDIVSSANAVRVFNTLFCVVCDLKIPFEDIVDEDDWQGIPILLRVPSLGKFRNISEKLAVLKRYNLRVYFPSDDDNLTAARVLSSVGIHTAIVFNEDTAPGWDSLADLMTYALLGTAPHAPIEPFQTMADVYRQGPIGDSWGRVYLDDPFRYIHIDAMGRVALSNRELLAGDFIANDHSAIGSLEIMKAIDDRGQKWQTFFLENSFCARCAGWKLCRGRFSDGKVEPDGCSEFFDEMTGIVEQYHNKSRSEKLGGIWRP